MEDLTAPQVVEPVITSPTDDEHKMKIMLSASNLVTCRSYKQANGSKKFNRILPKEFEKVILHYMVPLYILHYRILD